MSAHAQPFLTVEEYLELERASETRHEYYNGRMYAMSGGTFGHAHINGNLTGELYSLLKRGNCAVLPADMRTIAAGIYTYPDIVIVCDQPQFAHGQKDTLLNPAVVIEVLSPSTEGYDRGLKSAHYRKVESLREYALVSQDEPRVEVFSRQTDGHWLLSEYDGIASICHFKSVGCSIGLAEIYRGVNFDTNQQLRAAIPPTE